MADTTPPPQDTVPGYNPLTKQVEQFTPDELTTRWLRGDIHLAGNHSYDLLSPTGDVYSVPAKEVGESLRNGYRIATKDETARADARAPGQAWRAALEGGAEAVPGGTAALVAMGADPAGIKARQEEHPVARYAGMGTVMLGGTALLSTAELPMLGELVGGEKMAAAASAALGEARAASLAGRMAVGAAGSAVEGAVYGVGNLANEAALGDAQFTKEALIAHAGMGAFVGSALGGVGGAFGKARVFPTSSTVAEREALVEGATGVPKPAPGAPSPGNVPVQPGAVSAPRGGMASSDEAKALWNHYQNFVREESGPAMPQGADVHAGAEPSPFGNWRAERKVRIAQNKAEAVTRKQDIADKQGIADAESDLATKPSGKRGAPETATVPDAAYAPTTLARRVPTGSYEPPMDLALRDATLEGSVVSRAPGGALPATPRVPGLFGPGQAAVPSYERKVLEEYTTQFGGKEPPPAARAALLAEADRAAKAAAVPPAQDAAEAVSAPAADTVTAAAGTPDVFEALKQQAAERGPTNRANVDDVFASRAPEPVPPGPGLHETTPGLHEAPPPAPAGQGGLNTAQGGLNYDMKQFAIDAAMYHVLGPLGPGMRYGARKFLHTDTGAVVMARAMSAVKRVGGHIDNAMRGFVTGAKAVDALGGGRRIIAATTSDMLDSESPNKRREALMRRASELRLTPGPDDIGVPHLIAQHLPQASTNIQTGILGIQARLAATLPQLRSAGGLGITDPKRAWASVPDHEIRAFASIDAALQDPMRVVDAIGRGELPRPEVLQHVREVYPALYSRMQQAAINAMTEHGQDMGYVKATRLGTMFGIPGHDTMRPENIAAQQHALESATKAAAGPSAPRRGKSPGPRGPVTTNDKLMER